MEYLRIDLRRENTPREMQCKTNIVSFVIMLVLCILVFQMQDGS